jgi:hypothetical protein
MAKDVKRSFLLAAASVALSCTFGAGQDLKTFDVVTDQNGVSVSVALRSTANAIVRRLDHPNRIVVCFPNVSLNVQRKYVPLPAGGVEDVRIGPGCGSAPGTSIVVALDSARPYRVEQSESTFSLYIPSRSPEGMATNATPPSHTATVAPVAVPIVISAPVVHAASPSLEVEYPPVSVKIEEIPGKSAPEFRHRFRVKFVAANNVYIDGGSSEGLRMGMDFDIARAQAPATMQANPAETLVASAHIVGVATHSAILEIVASDDQLKPGDWADLVGSDAATAARIAARSQDQANRLVLLPLSESDVVKKGFLSTGNVRPEVATRLGGRVGIDYSTISSRGSTVGNNGEVGVLVESNMQHILGSHWNLEGYWRGRVNRHSQFREATIEETLNKTYTMQLYYENPDSKWVAGIGRLYLPWAVSLDTVDGGYFGRKTRFGMTTGLFAGSTPDISSWHYRPNQHIGGLFTNIQGGSYEGFHYSSTTGAALSSIKWKLDRPFLFFENELSYKRNVSLYHSLILDSPQGVSTRGIRPGVGVSHSYFTLHYQPMQAVGFDLYHNYFRDVPTATTTAVATGLVDSILFQGVSAGVHWRPRPQFAVYTTMGISDRTGDAHRSFNRMFGGTWYQIAHSGVRADYHYSRFNSNFGNGDYSVLTLSRQVTRRMFWNVQLANQNLISQHSTNYSSRFISDAVDVNLGRHTYLQTGYTLVDGVTLNYRQWYTSLGYRFDAGRSNPEFVQTLTH